MDNHNFASASTAFTHFERLSNRGTKRSRLTPRASPSRRASPSSRAQKTRRYVHVPISPRSPRGLIFTTGIVPTKNGKFPGISHGTRPYTKRSTSPQDTQQFDADDTQPTSQNTGGLRYKYKYKRLYRS